MPENYSEKFRCRASYFDYVYAFCKAFIQIVKNLLCDVSTRIQCWNARYFHCSSAKNWVASTHTTPHHSIPVDFTQIRKKRKNFRDIYRYCHTYDERFVSLPRWGGVMLWLIYWFFLVFWLINQSSDAVSYVRSHGVQLLKMFLEK